MAEGSPFSALRYPVSAYRLPPPGIRSLAFAEADLHVPVEGAAARVAQAFAAHGREHAFDLGLGRALVAGVDQREPAGREHARDLDRERGGRVRVEVAADGAARVDEVDAGVAELGAAVVAEALEHRLRAEGDRDG